MVTVEKRGQTLVRHQRPKADDHDGTFLVIQHMQNVATIRDHTFLCLANPIMELLGSCNITRRISLHAHHGGSPMK